MSKLDRLAAKPIEVTIEGVLLEIKPLSVIDDLQTVLDLEDPDIKVKVAAFKDLWKKTLKEAVPDATDKEIASVSLKHFKPLFEAIREVNGLNITAEEVHP